MKARYKSSSVSETREIGKNLIKLINEKFGSYGGVVVLLIGQLGTGKTEMVKGMAQGMGLQEKLITSPTFSIIQEYSPGKILHVDMYRIDEDEQSDILAVVSEKLEQNYLVVIEWGEKIPHELFSKKVFVKIDFGEGENEREIEISI